MNPPISEGDVHGYHAIARYLQIDTIFRLRQCRSVTSGMRCAMNCRLAGYCAQNGIHPNFVGSYVVAYACATTCLRKAPKNLPADFAHRMPKGHKIEIGATASAEVSSPIRIALQAQASAILRDLAVVRSD